MCFLFKSNVDRAAVSELNRTAMENLLNSELLNVETESPSDRKIKEKAIREAIAYVIPEHGPYEKGAKKISERQISQIRTKTNEIKSRINREQASQAAFIEKSSAFEFNDRPT